MTITALTLALALAAAPALPPAGTFTYEPFRDILPLTEETEQGKEAWEHGLFFSAVGFYASASVADWRTTVTCLPLPRCSEANPFGAWVYEEWEDAGMLAVKLVLTGAVITAMTWLWLTQADSKWEKIIIAGAMGVMAGVQGFVVDSNIKVLFSVSMGG